MLDVHTHGAKTKLSDLLALVEKKHEKVRIFRNGKPIAILLSVQESESNPLKKHPELQGITFLGDPTEPLDEDDWPSVWR